MDGEHLLEQVRIGECGRPEQHARGPGPQGVAHRLRRAQAPAELDVDVQFGADAAQLLEVDGLAAAGTVEVDHVQVARPRFDPGAGGGQRVGLVDRARGEVATHQAHRAAVEDVDRRIEPHRLLSVGAAAQMRVKLASRRRPAAEDFSGWNWTP